MKSHLLLMAALLLAANSSPAADLFWSGDGTTEGGAGAWNTTDARFGTSAGGPFGLVWDNAGSDNVTFESTAGTVTISSITNNGTLTDNSGYTFSGTTLTLGPSSAINVAAGQTTTASCVLAGGPLTKNGDGILVLNANNTYTGNTYLNAGTLGLGTAGTITFGANAADNHLVINADGVTIAQMSTSSRSPQNSVDQLGDVILDTGDKNANIAFVLKFGDWKVNGNRRITTTVTTGTGVMIIGNTPANPGHISEYSGTASLTKDGPGTLTIQAENDLTGGFTIEAGTVRAHINASSPFGSGTLTLSGGTLSTVNTRTSPITNAINVTADSTISNSRGVGNATIVFPFSGPLSGTINTTLEFLANTPVNQPFVASLSAGFNYVGKIKVSNNNGNPTTLELLNVPGDDQTFADVIWGDGYLTRSAASPGTGTGGTSFMNAANTFSGGTTLIDGAIGLGWDSDGAPPDTPITYGPLGTGTVTVNPAASCLPTLFTSASDRAFNNDINLANNTAPLVISNGGTLTLKGAITGSGILSKTGPGELRMSPRRDSVAGYIYNNYSGGTIINEGSIACDSSSGGSADAPTKGPVGTGPITFGNGGGISALSTSRDVGNHLVFSGTSAILTGSSDLTLSGNADLSFNTVTLTVNNSAATTLSGQISNGALTKDGPSTLALTGVNTYTGPTTVSTGTLLVNSPGSLDPSSAVTVYASATLGGSGTVGGSVTVNAGGSVSAGTSPGTLTVGGGLDLSAGGTNVWELAANSDTNPGGDFDQISLTGGNLVLGGSSHLLIKFTGTATFPDSGTAFWQASHVWTNIVLSGGAANPGPTTFATIDGVSGLSPSVGSFSTTTDSAGSVLLVYTPGLAPVTSFSIATGPGSDLTLSYSGGAGSQFVLVGTNNVAALLSLWTRLQTNTVSPGTFTITPGSDPQQFFRIKSE